jgi:transmembrane sensor
MDYKSFRVLLNNYLNNSCTEEERRIVDEWFEQLKCESQFPGDTDLIDIESRLWNKIQAQTAPVIPVKGSSISRTKYWLIAACIIGVILAAGILLTVNKKNTGQEPELAAVKIPGAFVLQANNTTRVTTIILEDGSTVQMYPGSKLSYPKQFVSQKREVYLQGDAFFSVIKNPLSPFYVYSQEIVTQALGTSFKVSGKNGRLEVDVKTGKVAVYENDDMVNLNELQQKSNGVIITPNQKVTYYKQERHFITSIVDQPLPVKYESDNTPPDTNQSYYEAPLAKVLKDMESAYELEIVLENEKIKTCLFTGDLTGENLFNKLESICLAFGASYEVKGTKILLKGGKECKTN